MHVLHATVDHIVKCQQILTQNKHQPHTEHLVQRTSTAHRPAVKYHETY